MTFDDGPNPIATQFVLDELSKYEAKATFFCLGENIEKHPDIAQKIIAQNHRLANHTRSHLNGWKTSNQTYLDDIVKCQEVISDIYKSTKKLFRPPYGRITKRQIRRIKNEFTVVLWNYMIGDFDEKLSKEKAWKNAKRSIKNGDVIVFHDNDKSVETMKFVLPKLLKYYSELGYHFKSL